VTLTAVRPSGLRPDLEGLVCEPSTPLTLAPGEGVRCRGRLVVGDAAAERGRLTVRAGGRGEAPYGSTATSRDDVTASTEVQVALTRSPSSDAGRGADRGRPTAPPSAPNGRPGDPPTDLGLADSGGPARGLLVAGLLGVLAGAAALLTSTRRRGRH
jgi:hypothetical protein